MTRVRNYGKWVKAWLEAHQAGRPYCLLPCVPKAQGKLF